MPAFAFASPALDVVGLLLEAKANPDKAAEDGCSAMLVASEAGHLEVVDLLLKAKGGS